MLEYRKNHLQPNDANEAKNNNRKICFCHYVGSTDPQYNHLFMFWFDINSNLSGGFGTYLFALSENIAKQATEANDAMNIKNPHLGWIIGFLFLVSFVGLFALVPMRKVETSLPQYFLHIYSIFKNTCHGCQLEYLVADYDCGLQADVSEWHCNCLPYQRIPHTPGCRACKVSNMPLYPSCCCFYNMYKSQEVLTDRMPGLFQEASSYIG